jgi:hypothetical protein
MEKMKETGPMKQERQEAFLRSCRKFVSADWRHKREKQQAKKHERN